MANQVPVFPDAQQLQDALAVPLVQAGAAQDAQNVDGGEQPAVVAQVAAPPVGPVNEPNAGAVSSPHPLLACFAFFLLLVASVVSCSGTRYFSLPSVSFLRICLCEFVSIIVFLLVGLIISSFRPSCCFEFVPLFVVVSSFTVHVTLTVLAS